MKLFITIIISILNILTAMSQESIYNIQINNINGEIISLKDFKGKKILFVNVASKCGFTKQYKELEELYQLYKEHLTIIGVPCNQFGGQEPENNKEIMSFCKKNYGVSFLLTEKIKVKGKEQHPLYSWLCSKEKNGKQDSKVRWNFQKYLIDEKGELIEYYYSTTQPMSSKIRAHLK